MGVNILDGILDGDNMSAPLLINLVYQAGQRRSFSASGRAGNQNHAVLLAIEINDRLGNMHPFTVRQPKCYDSKNGCQRASLLIGIAPEPSGTFYRKGEIVVPSSFQLFNITIGKLIDLLQQFFRRIRHHPI